MSANNTAHAASLRSIYVENGGECTAYKVRTPGSAAARRLGRRLDGQQLFGADGCGILPVFNGAEHTLGHSIVKHHEGRYLCAHSADASTNAPEGWAVDSAGTGWAVVSTGGVAL